MVEPLSSKVCSAEKYVLDNWSQPEKPAGFLREEIFSRAANVGLAPAFFIATTLDTAIGIGVGLCSLATLGKNEKVYQTATKFLLESSNIIRAPLYSLASALNPRPKFLDVAGISSDGNGFSTSLVIRPLYKKIDAFSESDNFITREVFSRLTVGFMAVCCVVTRVFDFIIGVTAMFLVVLTWRKLATVTNIAYQNLQVTLLIGDLVFCAIGLLNPKSHYFQNSETSS